MLMHMLRNSSFISIYSFHFIGCKLCFKVVSTGGDGVLILAQREYKVLTYRSLQPKFDFLDRGVTKLRDYFYRDHSMMLWGVIQK